MDLPTTDYDTHTGSKDDKSTTRNFVPNHNHVASSGHNTSKYNLNSTIKEPVTLYSSCSKPVLAQASSQNFDILNEINYFHNLSKKALVAQQ